MSTWEDRMAARAAARRATAELAEEQAEKAEHDHLVAEGILLPGEDGLIALGPHEGHAVHGGWHGGMVVCQCGAILGVPCFVVSEDMPEPEPCPVCTARGIPLDVR